MQSDRKTYLAREDRLYLDKLQLESRSYLDEAAEQNPILSEPSIKFLLMYECLLYESPS